MNKIILTKKGEEKLKINLKNLKKEKKNLIEEFDRTRKMGDLSENSEYLTIKNLKILNENKIKKLENILSSYEIFNIKNIKDKNKVLFSANIELENLENKKIISYKIVSNEEINIENKFISIDSPLAKIIIGKKLNDIVNLKKLNKNVSFKIISIKYEE